MKKIISKWKFVEWFSIISVPFANYYLNLNSELIVLDNIDYNSDIDCKNKNWLIWPFFQIDDWFRNGKKLDEQYEEYNWYFPVMYNYIDKWWKILSKNDFMYAWYFNNTEALVELFWIKFKINNRWELKKYYTEYSYNDCYKNTGATKFEIYISNNNWSDIFENFIDINWNIINKKWWCPYTYNWDKNDNYVKVSFINWKYNIINKKTWKIFDDELYDNIEELYSKDKVKLKKQWYSDKIIDTNKWIELKWFFKYF